MERLDRELRTHADRRFAYLTSHPLGPVGARGTPTAGDLQSDRDAHIIYAAARAGDLVVDSHDASGVRVDSLARLLDKHRALWLTLVSRDPSTGEEHILLSQNAGSFVDASHSSLAASAVRLLWVAAIVALVAAALYFAATWWYTEASPSSLPPPTLPRLPNQARSRAPQPLFLTRAAGGSR